MFNEFVIVVGLVSGAIEILVFVTGQPSFRHFKPLENDHGESVTGTFWVKRRFFLRNDTVFIRGRQGDVPLLPQLSRVNDYRIFVSPSRKRLIVVYGYKHESARFKRLIVANFDGSCSKKHDYRGGIIVDVRWHDDESYRVFLDNDPGTSPQGYPDVWHKVRPERIGKSAWDDGPIDGRNYRVWLSRENDVIDLRKF